MPQKNYRLEFQVNGVWYTYGIYPTKFINMLVAGICDCYQKGCRPYESIRVTVEEVRHDG